MGTAEYEEGEAMSPLIDLQRRLVEVGRIRMGEKNAQGYPTKLQTWKLTSRDKVRLDAAAECYGGTVIQWEGHEGQWAVITATNALPILLMPGQTLSQHYELWSGGGCQRRCDGELESISDGPCKCDPDNRECKPHSRLAVMLPDVPGLGCWRLDTQGYYAAVELAGAVDLLEMATVQGVLLPARLRIDQRTSIRGGQTRHYPVPTLDLDIRPLEMIQIARGGQPPAPPTSGALNSGVPPSSFTPLPAAAVGPSLSEGLAAVESGGSTVPRTARSAAPIGESGSDFLSDAPLMVPSADNGPSEMLASEAQQRLIRARAGSLGLTDDERHAITEHICGDPSSKNVPARLVDILLDWLEIEAMTTELMEAATELGKHDEMSAAIAGRRAAVDEFDFTSRSDYKSWLTRAMAAAMAARPVETAAGDPE